MKKFKGAEKELARKIEVFIQNLMSREDGATVVALLGELGAGKTTFAQVAARALGVTEHVTSPTFVILKRYKVPTERYMSHAPRFALFVHIDAYRLESGRELEALGWHELAADPKNLILIEWADRVKELLPEHTVKISLAHESDMTRTMTIHEKSGE